MSFNAKFSRYQSCDSPLVIQFRMACCRLLLLGLHLNVILLLTFGNLGTTAGESSIAVSIDGSTGNDRQCHQDRFRTPCFSLEWVAKIATNYNESLTISIGTSGSLPLMGTVVFQNYTEVRLVGPSLIECRWDSLDDSPGIVFHSIGNVTIDDLSIIGCGVYQKVLSVLSAVHLYGCTNVNIRNITVNESNGAGLFISNMAGGIANISDSCFSHNAIKFIDHQHRFLGGNGVYLHVNENAQSSSVEFNHCMFVGNSASTPEMYVFLSDYRGVRRGHGSGGGLQAYIHRTSSNTSIKIIDCRFINNTAFIGGGLAVSVKRSENFSLLLKKSSFEQNGCSSLGSGGGLSIGVYFIRDYQHAVVNSFQLEHLSFTDNCAHLGGGAVFYFGKTKHRYADTTMRVSNSLWMGNTARIGAAVDVASFVGDKLQRGYLPFVEFSNCNFTGNAIVPQWRDSQYEVGRGVLLSTEVDIRFVSKVNFGNNVGTALFISNAIASFSSANASFTDNTAFQGGAVALMGTSYLLLGCGRSYIFYRNRARDQGGAIYANAIDIHDLAVTKTCFLQFITAKGLLVSFNLSNTTVQFRDNAASNVGASIFATSLVPCAFYPQSWSYGNIMQWATSFDYGDNSKIELEVASEGSRFQVTEPEPISVIPGEEFKLPLIVLDDLNNPIPTVYRVSVAENGSTVIKLDDNASYISENIKLGGSPGEKGALLVETISSKKISVLVHIVFAPCPVGFQNIESKCECTAQLYAGFLGCDHMRANITYGFWAGFVYDKQRGREVLATAACPAGFCQYGLDEVRSSVQLPRNISELDEFICGQERTGVLCGKCRVGRTVYFHSPRYSCYKRNLCRFGALFYILSEVVPITLLFVTVIFLDISFTSGAISGLILFAQLLDTMNVDGSGMIDTPASGPAGWGYNLIYGVFSLNFFSIEPLSFCVFPDGTALDVLALRLISVLYAFLLIVAVVIYIRYCGYRLGRFIRITTIRSSVIHGLTAFIVVSYVQCVKASMNILLPKSLRTEHASLVQPQRVFFNGNVTEFGKNHLAYAITAVLFLVVFGPLPPVVLLVYPALNRPFAWFRPRRGKVLQTLSCKNRSCFLHPSKFMPLLDSFQGHFKANCRFFAGLYFIYRWIFILANSVSITLGHFYFAAEIILALMLAIHSMMQPYRIKWHNLIDTLLFADLLIVNTFSACIYYFTRSTERDFNDNFLEVLGSVQLVFIYLPIVYFIGLVLTPVYRKYHVYLVRAFHFTVTLRERQSISQRNSSLLGTAMDEFPARLVADYASYNNDNVSVTDNPLGSHSEPCLDTS